MQDGFSMSARFLLEQFPTQDARPWACSWKRHRPSSANKTWRQSWMYAV
jgi:hypothetical protein